MKGTGQDAISGFNLKAGSRGRPAGRKVDGRYLRTARCNSEYFRERPLNSHCLFWPFASKTIELYLMYFVQLCLQAGWLVLYILATCICSLFSVLLSFLSVCLPTTDQPIRLAHSLPLSSPFSSLMSFRPSLPKRPGLGQPAPRPRPPRLRLRPRRRRKAGRQTAGERMGGTEGREGERATTSSEGCG